MLGKENVRNKILYVDDDEKSRIFVRKILESEGFLVTEADNGLSAIEEVTRMRPDLLIMDLQMPVMDGITTMKKIREVPELMDLPAIALTARGLDQERDHIIKAGYHGYLAKPVQRMILLEEVDRLLLQMNRYNEDKGDEKECLRDEKLVGKKVLLVDDNPMHLQLGEKILSSTGMEVLKAVDGKDALKILEGGQSVDIILTDILMPGMDGYQFCRRVKTTGSFMNIPLLFYTSTYVDNQDIRFGLDLGAERYIVRPITSNRLLEIVKEVMKNREEGVHSQTEVSQEALMVDDVKYYREYNERLISKLEQKLLEIDSAYRTLEMRNDELKNFNRSLEQNVEVRTKELEEANQRLVELDKKKTEFLNIVAHDLRTPMTTIRSYAELLLKYPDEPITTRNEFLEIVISESIRLGNLVNDYLDLIKIESGSYEFKQEAVQLNERVQHAVNVFKSRSDAKGITVETHYDLKMPMVMGDPDKLDQVLINLFSNAVKFCSGEGKIEVYSSMVEPGQSLPIPSTKAQPLECKSALVMIRDTGPGIPENYHEMIFDKFKQIDSSFVRESGGTGLGLSIVKWIVNQHQGKIWVESHEGEGSAFFLQLPCLD